uniref:Uncharacterized protein n=1 Tax=Eutreptiella gymnastica TaxID=73025 RepID=A0A7S1NMS9_9EUGL
MVGNHGRYKVCLRMTTALQRGDDLQLIIVCTTIDCYHNATPKTYLNDFPFPIRAIVPGKWRNPANVTEEARSQTTDMIASTPSCRNVGGCYRSMAVTVDPYPTAS